MSATHTLGFSIILILSIILVSYADPGHVHTKHVIHAPLHIKLIHHHKVIKVPVVFRKHLHHHKHFSHEHVYIPLKEKPKPVYEEVEGDGHDYNKGHKGVEHGLHEGNSGEGGDYGSDGHFQIHIIKDEGGGNGGHGGYSYGSDKSDDNSYEYDEAQDVGARSSYRFHSIH